LKAARKVVLRRPGRCGPVVQVGDLAGEALLLLERLMITKVLLPLSGPITWMPDWLDAVRASEGCERWGLSAGLFPWRGKSALIGERNRLGAVAGVNLGEQVVDVTLDGALADDEVFGDLAVRHAGGDQ
jgi:hypothetical protein